MRLPLRVSTLILAVGLLPAAPTFAQSVGSIAGTVLDASKASVPGAVVTARNEGTGAVREVVTDEAGRYAMPLLPIGSYTVTAAMSGFQTQERNKVVLEVQASLTLDFVADHLDRDHRGHGHERGRDRAAATQRCVAGPVDQRAAGGRAAAERPQLRPARAARPGHRDRARRQLPGPGPEQRGVLPRQHVGVGAGHARERQRLALRRRRRQRADAPAASASCRTSTRSASSRSSPTTTCRSTAAAAARRCS